MLDISGEKVKEAIIYENLDSEFYTSEKCYITELVNTPHDPDVSIARARVEAGVTTCWHRLKKTKERYIILKGKGLVEIGNLLAKEVNVGDVVLIPPKCRQRITNIGSDDLIFLAICTPRFSIDNYEAIEKNQDT